MNKPSHNLQSQTLHPAASPLAKPFYGLTVNTTGNALIFEKDDWLAHEKHSSTTPNKEKDKTKSPKKLNVLLIEDDPIAQTAHTDLLLQEKCQIDLAQNAKSALAMANTLYDLILVDIGLPDKNGIQVAAELRYGHNINTKIVAVTAYATDNVKKKCLGAGIDLVVSKPLDAEQLYEILNTIRAENNLDNIGDECLNDPKMVRKIKQELLRLYHIALENAPKPENMSESQYINYLAIQLLEETGNEFPTQKAITFVESFLKRRHKKISKVPILTEVEKQKKITENFQRNKSFFTYYEAEYSIHFLENKSLEEIANILELSLEETQRIYEDLKTKLNCRSNVELQKKLSERIFGSI